jgi:hypothetical protein
MVVNVATSQNWENQMTLTTYSKDACMNVRIILKKIDVQIIFKKDQLFCT